MMKNTELAYLFTAVLGATVAFSLSYVYNNKLNKEKDTTDTGNDQPSNVTVTIPSWASSLKKDNKDKIYTTDEEKMSLAIQLSSENVSRNTGGPFGAAIFECLPCTTTNDDDDDNKNSRPSRLVSIGMNRVVPLGNSCCHAEVVAIQFAQAQTKTFSLNDVPGRGAFELYTSCEPCAMCLGATLWSGVGRVVCGASKADATAVGFDEGPVYEESYGHLETAGVRVKRGVLREEAAGVLRRYGENGTIYNR